MATLVTVAERHQERLRQITQLLQIKIEDFDLEALRLMLARLNDFENILKCEFAHNHYLPPLEVDGEDFKDNAAKFLEESKRRTVRIASGVSICCSDPLNDPFAWCPVCKDLTRPIEE